MQMSFRGCLLICLNKDESLLISSIDYKIMGWPLRFLHETFLHYPSLTALTVLCFLPLLPKPRVSHLPATDNSVRVTLSVPQALLCSISIYRALQMPAIVCKCPLKAHVPTRLQSQKHKGSSVKQLHQKSVSVRCLIPLWTTSYL